MVKFEEKMLIFHVRKINNPIFAWFEKKIWSGDTYIASPLKVRFSWYHENVIFFLINPFIKIMQTLPETDIV